MNSESEKSAGLLKWKEKEIELLAPRTAGEPGDTSTTPKKEKKLGRKNKEQKMVQLNLRVTPEVKRHLEVLKAQHRREMSNIVMEAIALFEEKHGVAMGLKPLKVA